jgi:hypothetical protein
VDVSVRAGDGVIVEGAEGNDGEAACFVEARHGGTADFAEPVRVVFGLGQAILGQQLFALQVVQRAKRDQQIGSLRSAPSFAAPRKWQCVAPLGCSLIANLMPPHRQLPLMLAMRERSGFMKALAARGRTK